MMSRSRGFTLVELLVAVGITAVLAAVLLSLVTRTIALWERSASSLMLENEADLILRRLTTDLESAYQPVGDLAAEPWIGVVRSEEVFSELRLIVPTAGTSSDDADPAAPREVTYRLQDGGLYRFERTASETLGDGYRWAAWPVEAEDEFLLGERVEELAVLFTDRDRNEIITPTNSAWPALARIELVLLTPDGEQRFEAIEAGFSNEPTDQILAESSREFVQWLAMGGGR